MLSDSTAESSKHTRSKAYPGSYFQAPQLLLCFLSPVRDPHRCSHRALALPQVLSLSKVIFVPLFHFPLSSFCPSVPHPSQSLTQSPSPWPLVSSVYPILVVSVTPGLTFPRPHHSLHFLLPFLLLSASSPESLFQPGTPLCSASLPPLISAGSGAAVSRGTWFRFSPSDVGSSKFSCEDPGSRGEDRMVQQHQGNMQI